MKVKFEDPCALVRDSLKSSNEADTIYNWCKSTFHQDFIEPFSKFCSQVHPEKKTKALIKKSKQKRAVGTAMIIGSAIITAGISAISLWYSESNKFSLMEVGKIQNSLLNRMNQTEENEKKIKEILLNLTNTSDVIENALQNLTNEV